MPQDIGRSDLIAIGGGAQLPTHVASATTTGWLAWRERARREGNLELERDLESIAADAANLMTGVLGRREHRLACSRSRSLVRLFDAAATYAWGEPPRAASAEGCIRVAVAIARGRGFGVMLRGRGTELPLAAPFETTLPALLRAVEAARAVGSSGYVQIHLRLRDFRLSCVDFASDAPERALRELGWAVSCDREGRLLVGIARRRGPRRRVPAVPSPQT